MYKRTKNLCQTLPFLSLSAIDDIGEIGVNVILDYAKAGRIGCFFNFQPLDCLHIVKKGKETDTGVIGAYFNRCRSAFEKQGGNDDDADSAVVVSCDGLSKVLIHDFGIRTGKGKSFFPLKKHSLDDFIKRSESLNISFDFGFDIYIWLVGLWRIEQRQIPLIKKDEWAVFNIFPAAGLPDDWGGFFDIDSGFEVECYESSYKSRHFNGFIGGFDKVVFLSADVLQFIDALEWKSQIKPTDRKSDSISDNQSFKPNNIEKAMLLYLNELQGTDYSVVDIVDMSKDAGLSYGYFLKLELLKVKRSINPAYKQTNLIGDLFDGYSDKSGNNKFALLGLSVDSLKRYFSKVNSTHKKV